MTTLPILRKTMSPSQPTSKNVMASVCVAGRLWLSLLLVVVFLLSLDTLQVKSLLVYDRQALLDLQHNVGDLSRTWTIFTLPGSPVPVASFDAVAPSCTFFYQQSRYHKGPHLSSCLWLCPLPSSFPSVWACDIVTVYRMWLAKLSHRFPLVMLSFLKPLKISPA